jgi:hypothetical protein
MTPGLSLADEEVPLKAEAAFFGGGITVMTRNIYVGADVDRVIEGGLGELEAVMQQLFSTSYPDRAAGFANEILKARPHLIGIQEDSVIRGNIPGIGTIELDFLAILTQILEAYGLQYQAFRSNKNVDVTIPLVEGSMDYYIQLIDYDTILAREDVEVSDFFTKNYVANLPVPTLGLTIQRSYSAVTAKIGKKSYRFVNTHLEAVPESFPDVIYIQLGQAQELLGYLQVETLPIILVGDLNTEATGGVGQTYQLIKNSGYTDIWTRNLLRRNPQGFTSSHAKDLRNTEVTLNQRIDLIFVRSHAGFCGWQVIGPVLAWAVGDELMDRVWVEDYREWIWPSDHAGVIARLHIPRF